MQSTTSLCFEVFRLCTFCKKRKKHGCPLLLNHLHFYIFSLQVHEDAADAFREQGFAVIRKTKLSPEELAEVRHCKDTLCCLKNNRLASSMGLHCTLLGKASIVIVRGGHAGPLLRATPCN